MNWKVTQHLRSIVAAHKTGRPVGIMSVCSANRFVLEAAMRQAEADDTFVCIESTAAQVNQFGGYTGMTPARFAAFVRRTARDIGFPEDRVLLGADHLGPGPWRKEPAESALARACELAAACVSAGYVKIHLDAATACIDDAPTGGPRLPVELAAQRTALLAAAAETAAGAPEARPLYVIGTDVPAPGGTELEGHEQRVSDVADVDATIAATRRCFESRRLQDAWRRTIAVVVDSGADFSPETVTAYDRHRTADLAAFIEAAPRLVFEAHSTDYQAEAALTAMVADHFAILKVGPALTFALREALTALAHVEDEWLAPRRKIEASNLRQVVETVMRADPTHWQRYHRVEAAIGRYPFYYSFSDRVRYYWNRPDVRAAVDRLLENFGRREIPLPLLSQYLPEQVDLVRAGGLHPTAAALVNAKIMAVTARYAAACRSAEHAGSVIGP